MIAQLRGTIIEHDGQMIIVDVGGVGYGVLVSASEQAALPSGNETRLYIYENIKEDAHDLIGFTELATKRLFEQLLSVKNVGPKVALAVLDVGTADEVRVAIAGGDVKKLQTAKGVGKRAAEQIVVELRDKVGAPVGDAAEAVIGRSGIHATDEAVQALIALGYSDVDAHAALTNIDPTLPVEERIKKALAR